ncbi:hypothetical protein BDZ97DRAFT_1761045 [Flammula alnicola]|nr:hypothetical protein BDZ97DRAFT_1761045 [Flammula alnicola]
MPSSPDTTSQPHPDVINGPRKRRPSERVTKNGDPLAQKKAKTTFATTKKPAGRPSASKAPNKATSSRNASIEDVPEPVPAPLVQPRHPQRILEASNGSDDDNVQFVGMPGLEPVENDDDEEDIEADSEDDEAELARLAKDWDAPIYVFFKPMPSVEYINGRKAHVFECGASQCRCRTRFVRRFLDTGDAKSTSNLR